MPWLIALTAFIFAATTLAAIAHLRATPKTDPWRWRALLWPQATFILFVLALAYDGTFATGRVAQLLSHGGDKAGHMILFGLLALGTHFATCGRSLTVRPIEIPLAILLPMSFATVEEALQSLSPHRTADPVDLLCDLVGMVLFWRVGVRLTRQESSSATHR